VIGLVGRLADQKGWDLVLAVMQRFLEERRAAQWVVLGTGNPAYHEQLERLSDRYPGTVGVHLGFSDHLAHRIEAGSDLFLMPSRYEPCGLNQLYSLRYGTVPVVNPTGGLADTVTDATAASYADATATGFHLQQFNADGLAGTLQTAIETYQNAPHRWAQLVETGMRQDWSWGQSALQYETLYADTISRKRKTVVSSMG
jgi:starch synthase